MIGLTPIRPPVVNGKLSPLAEIFNKSSSTFQKAVAAKKRIVVIDEFELPDITDDVTDLAGAFMGSGVIPKNSPTDAAHIAIAAVHEMNYLMTWNCAHIANAEISSVVEDVCKSHGFNCPVICTTEELMGG